MGKPSKKSRISSSIRKKKRKSLLAKNLKSKDNEIADLQIEMLDIKNFIERVGDRAVNEFNKCSRENTNLVNWLKIYDEQIKGYEKEIYNLSLRLHFLSSPQPQPQLQPQP